MICSTMTVILVILYFLCLINLFLLIIVTTTANSMVMLLAGVTFIISISFILLILGVSFIPLLIIIIYVGALAILYIFAILFIYQNEILPVENKIPKYFYVIIGLFIGSILINLFLIAKTERSVTIREIIPSENYSLFFQL